MKRLISWVLILVLSFSIVGCGRQQRNAALAAIDQAKKTYNEHGHDLYAMAVREAIALCKARVKEAIKDGTAEQMVTIEVPVTIKTPDGKITAIKKTIQMTKVDAIINQSCQQVVTAAWHDKQFAKADQLQDLAWIHTNSQKPFIELFMEDVKNAVMSKDGSPETQPAF